MNDCFQVSGIAVVGKLEWRKRAVFTLNANIPDLPSFLRIKSIAIENGYLSEEGFQLILPLLLQLKSSFIDSHLVVGEIYAINESKIFAFILERLVPFFDSSMEFNFLAECNSDDGTAFLASLLQQLNSGSTSTVEMRQGFFSFRVALTVAQLPIEAISIWLHKHSFVESTSKAIQKRSLHIFFANIGNILEMVEHLKQVMAFFNFSENQIHFH